MSGVTVLSALLCRSCPPALPHFSPSRGRARLGSFCNHVLLCQNGASRREVFQPRGRRADSAPASAAPAASPATTTTHTRARGGSPPNPHHRLSGFLALGPTRSCVSASSQLGGATRHFTQHPTTEATPVHTAGGWGRGGGRGAPAGGRIAWALASLVKPSACCSACCCPAPGAPGAAVLAAQGECQCQ